ncbi:hypothetical protein [Bacillus alkalicellulosilyticus]|uniref:hypothetical protein n=1 Tax=Alkalihalobacterium alkalicellulosilyticum TaxID=1912214 RepID=UPI001FE9DFFE|nr:hypothetical protein [Bacillus alkalicellulosilyticus]
MNLSDEKAMHHEVALRKVQEIAAGYSAYSETTEVTSLIHRLLAERNIEAYEEKKEIGSWFIPIHKKE